MRAVIVNPSRVLGGTEFVYLLIAEELAKRGEQVTIIDLPDGWTASPSIGLRIEQANISLVSALSAKWNLEGTDIVLCSAKFVQLTYRQGRAEGVDVSSNVLAWLLHPHELYSNQFRMFKRLAVSSGVARRDSFALEATLAKWTGNEKRMRELLRQDRLNPMDETTSMSIAQHFPDIRPTFFPVPVSDNGSGTDCMTMPHGRGVMSIIWISRLDGFKLPPLIKTLQELSHSPTVTRRGVRVTIVGDGDGMPRLKQLAQDLPKTVELDFKGFLTADKLRELLAHTSFDLAVGMGTSLSLCAAYGIASVITTIADDVAEYAPGAPAFRLLGSRGSYSLGEYQNAKPPCFRYFPLERILAHATHFGAIGKAQRRWYRETYGASLSSYIDKIYKEGRAAGAVPRRATKSIFHRFVNFTLTRILYKNAAFPP